MSWPSHWLLGEDHEVFRRLVSAAFSGAAADLAHEDARESIGAEDTQCQHFFSKAFSQMKSMQDDLTEGLLCCSKMLAPVLELRYYRSVTRRSRERRRPQLVEAETGADFALTLEVSVPNGMVADRSVLGQAKLVHDDGIPINRGQLARLLDFAGPESGAYLMWGNGKEPVVVSAENIDMLGRASSTNRLDLDVLGYGKPFVEFLVESFIGLWFGRDYNRAAITERIPSQSPTALYMMLHTGRRPPNVIHLGIGTSCSRDRRAGVYVQEVTNLDADRTDNRG